MLERTGVVTVDVGSHAAAERLAARVLSAGMQAEVDEGLLEVTVGGDADLDRIRDAIAELELPLYRLGSRLTSLDEVFFEKAVH